MKKRGFLLIIIFVLLTANIVFSDSIPLYIRPLSAGNIQSNTAFDYQFNLTSDQACSNVLYSTIETVTTDNYGIGFVEIDTSSLTSTPSYLCEYRALSGDGLALRQVHNISSGFFNKTYIKEINSILINGSTVYSGGINVTTWLYNMSDGSYNITYAIYAYNQTDYILTITNANFTALNASVTKWLYNMSDGSYNATYNKYAYNMSDGSYNATYHGLNVSYGKYWYNMSDGSYNATYDAGINASWNQSWADTLYSAIAWGYNMTLGAISYITQSSINLQSNITDINTTLDTKFSTYNYNMSDGSYNATYAKYAYNMSDGSYNATYDIWSYNQTQTNYDNLNVTNNFNATNITTTNISIGPSNIFWNGSNLIIKG
ncbi:MAG: hypothetical protein KKD48_00980 [Nanoarchaeota archaeon]|nr:hypothetical protein [Nanoarchaeota archaeon]